ncbi:MAG TPA: hypothetical protein VMR98_05255 [Candidatus Polarisedimenticolaceae bacterium]|nr:hypothetical protein [Candidatus Polarisedimenticolaceae bacterium]
MASKRKSANNEYDSVYFLKVLLYLLLGTVWLAFDGKKYIPVGIIAGILIAQHERLQLDRKIEYAMLIVGGLLGMIGIGLTFWL